MLPNQSMPVVLYGLIRSFANYVSNHGLPVHYYLNQKV